MLPKISLDEKNPTEQSRQKRAKWEINLSTFHYNNYWKGYVCLRPDIKFDRAKWWITYSKWNQYFPLQQLLSLARYLMGNVWSRPEMKSSSPFSISREWDRVKMTIGQNCCWNSPLCSAAWLDIAGATHYCTVAVLSSTLSHSLEMEKGEELSISGLEHTFPIEYRAKESSCCSGKYWFHLELFIT